MTAQMTRSPRLVNASAIGRATIALLLVGAAACSDNASPVTAPAIPQAPALGKNTTGSNQRILFTSDRDGNPEIYSMNTDGTGVTRLTNDPGADMLGAWSPDGKRIAFTSTRHNPIGEIYLMNADGSGVVRLTNTPGTSQAASWSKDGKQLVFMSNRDAANPANGTIADVELYVVNADGTGTTRLTFNSVTEAYPMWSPDGRRIAFTSGRDHPGTDMTDLYTMNPDGTSITRLTDQDGNVELPSWEPHGRSIAFSTSFATANGIFVVNATGGGLTRLTFGASGTDMWPSFSTDGASLAFASARNGNIEIYSMKADGTAQTRLTTTAASNVFPRWSR
jgi:Tol biopolymer transport system component